MTHTALGCHVCSVHSLEESGEHLALCAKGSERVDIPGSNDSLVSGTECRFGLFGLFVVLRRTG